jgi:glutamate synthase (NADPH/NADH) small chain
MGKLKGFLEHARATSPKRPVPDRLGDWREFEAPLSEGEIRAQGARCMECGVPFCHSGCPLGNVIPDWNDLVTEGRWEAAAERLHATNNFPEFTGRVCPAPCEEACVLGINDDPVSIKQIERQIGDHARNEGGLAPRPAAQRTGKRVAIVGSGPAGLACAQQLARAGHAVTIFERADRAGGLLRYGIPDFKMEKHLIDDRLAQMEAEGVELRCGVDVGRDVTAEALRRDYDAICVATGSTRPRELPLPGRDLQGIHLAMDFLEPQNRVVAGDELSGPIRAEGKRVVVIGGGDTGSDCLGTSLRQGATEVHQLEILPRPPDARSEDMPWPWWPMIYRTSSSQEEGGDRDFALRTTHFEGNADGRVTAVHAVRVEWSEDERGRRTMTDIPGATVRIEADLVLLALGFVGPERGSLLSDLGVKFTPRDTIRTAAGSYRTHVAGVYACGDARRGQSLVVWAIWEGREAARSIDLDLRGETALPTAPGPLAPL